MPDPTATCALCRQSGLASEMEPTVVGAVCRRCYRAVKPVSRCIVYGPARSVGKDLVRGPAHPVGERGREVPS